MIALLLIVKSKDNTLYSQHKFKVFIFGFLFIIFLETSTKFISLNFILNNILYTPYQTIDSGLFYKKI